MKKINLLICVISAAFSLNAQTVSTFENLTLATDTFWDGSDLSGSFTDGNAQFMNDYNTAFMAWSGFVYTNMQDTSTPGYMNQYSAITGSGYNNSSNYAIADDYGNAKIVLTGSATGKPVKGCYVTNTTYAYLSMKNGDQFTKKFGGATGTDPDWFLLKAVGWLNGALKQQSAEIYMADFRSADSTQDYILKEWTWFNLQPLGDVDSIQLLITTSDTTFGIPVYVAIDDFTTTNQSNATPQASDDYVSVTYLQDTLLDVLVNDFDTTATPLIVQLLNSPIITGASAVVTNNQIHYTPAIGIVAVDTLVYSVCDQAWLCDTAKVVVNVTGITSAEDITAGKWQIQVYPNPFKEQLIIQTNADSEIMVSMYDQVGRVVLTQNSFGSTLQIKTDELASGLYYLRLTSGGNTTMTKVIKQ